jgi:hypothetical protein
MESLDVQTGGDRLPRRAAFDVPEVHRWTVRDGKAVSGRFAIDTAATLTALTGG